MRQFYHPDTPPQQILARWNPLKNKALRFPVRITQKKLATRGGFCIFLTSADALQHQPTKTMTTTINDALPMTHLGNIPNNRNVTFYRVEEWKSGCFVADFALKSQAESFAISDARVKNCKYDHKVSRVVLVKTTID
jgi:hypothetical protein